MSEQPNNENTVNTVLQEFASTPTKTNEMIENLKLRKGETMTLFLKEIKKEIVDYNKKNTKAEDYDPSKKQEEFVLYLDYNSQTTDPDGNVVDLTVPYTFSRKLTSPVLETLKQQVAKGLTLPCSVTFVRSADQMGTYEVFADPTLNKTQNLS